MANDDRGMRIQMQSADAIEKAPEEKIWKRKGLAGEAQNDYLSASTKRICQSGQIHRSDRIRDKDSTEYQLSPPCPQKADSKLGEVGSLGSTVPYVFVVVAFTDQEFAGVDDTAILGVYRSSLTAKLEAWQYAFQDGFEIGLEKIEDCEQRQPESSLNHDRKGQ
ncbi:MAG: hypothetical protein Q9227_001760 [Pyrenula ochraceoflavens]